MDDHDHGNGHSNGSKPPVTRRDKRHLSRRLGRHFKSSFPPEGPAIYEGEEIAAGPVEGAFAATVEIYSSRIGKWMTVCELYARDARYLRARLSNGCRVTFTDVHGRIIGETARGTFDDVSTADLPTCPPESIQ